MLGTEARVSPAFAMKEPVNPTCYSHRKQTYLALSSPAHSGDRAGYMPLLLVTDQFNQQQRCHQLTNNSSEIFDHHQHAFLADCYLHRANRFLVFCEGSRKHIRSINYFEFLLGCRWERHAPINLAAFSSESYS